MLLLVPGNIIALPHLMTLIRVEHFDLKLTTLPEGYVSRSQNCIPEIIFFLNQAAVNPPKRDVRRILSPLRTLLQPYSLQKEVFNTACKSDSSVYPEIIANVRNWIGTMWGFFGKIPLTNLSMNYALTNNTTARLFKVPKKTYTCRSPG